MTKLLIRYFVKDYKNTKSAKVRVRYGKLASIVGIVSNIILFILKIVIGIIFKSVSISADAINNLSDTGSSLVTLFGFKISSKPADVEHPYGHARMEYISGLVVSFIISFLGLELIKSSFEKIIHPTSIEYKNIVYIVLIISILIKLYQAIFYRKIGRIINSETLEATSTDSRNDCISTLSVLIAAIITKFTGINLDGYIGLVVAILILVSGINLIKKTANPLIGVAPSAELVQHIYKKILSYDGILGLHDLHVHSYGEGKIFASVHCEVDANQDILISHDIIDNIERDFLKNDNINIVIHLDPIVTDDERVNNLNEMLTEVLKNIDENLSLHDFRVSFGITHTNLIFDVVVPFNYEYTDEEVIDIITEEIQKVDNNYRTSITIDYDFIGNNEPN